MAKVKCKACGKEVPRRKAVEDLKTKELYCSIKCLTKQNDILPYPK
jgi:ribosomal protein S26